MESLVRLLSPSPLPGVVITVNSLTLASSSVQANLVDGGVLVGLPPEVQQAIKILA